MVSRRFVVIAFGLLATLGVVSVGPAEDGAENAYRVHVSGMT